MMSSQFPDRQDIPGPGSGEQATEFSSQGEVADGKDCAREITDRRSRPTPLFSRYTLFGKRRENRRVSDPAADYAVDRSSGFHLKATIGMALLVIADALSTLHIISHGGVEANPLMAYLLEMGTAWFVTVKIGTALVGLVLFNATPRFRRGRPLAYVLFAIYSTLLGVHIRVLMQIYL